MSLPPEIVAQLIDAVRRAAKSEIMPRFRNLAAEDISSKSSPDDLVTIADKRAEAAIATAALDALPKALIVGEEAAETDPSLVAGLADAELAVIIDPVDGTGNFASGLAVFGVILAVIRDGQTVFGLLYDPVMDDWVLAEQGQGASFVQGNGARRALAPNTPVPLREMNGYIALQLFEPEARACLARTFADFKFVGNLRCSCHEYRMMALGHAQFSLSAFAKPWDHLAGALVMSELGGSVSTLGRDPYSAANLQAPVLAMAFPACPIGSALEARFEQVLAQN